MSKPKTMNARAERGLELTSLNGHCKIVFYDRRYTINVDLDDQQLCRLAQEINRHVDTIENRARNIRKALRNEP